MQGQWQLTNNTSSATFSLSCTVLSTWEQQQLLRSYTAPKHWHVNTNKHLLYWQQVQLEAGLGRSDRFSKIRVCPCFFLTFHVFQSMPLLWTLFRWAPYRANHCFVQLFIWEEVNKEQQICNDLWKQIPFSLWLVWIRRVFIQIW